MEVCLDLVFVDAIQKINDELTADLFDIEINDEHIEVDIWVKVDPNTFRFNLPLFTVSHHEFMGFLFEPSFFKSSFYKSSNYAPDCAVISITPLSNLYARTAGNTITLDEVIVETQKYVKNIEGSRALREELYYDYKKYMGYPVPPRPSDKKIILRANPEITPTNSKTEIKRSEKDFRRRYDINGYYSS